MCNSTWEDEVGEQEAHAGLGSQGRKISSGKSVNEVVMRMVSQKWKTMRKLTSFDMT